MKKTIITLTLAMITGALSLAKASNPDSIYIYLNDANVGNVVAFAIEDLDSIAYIAPVPTSGTFTDGRDNNTYKWKMIGEQTWMAENLRFGMDNIDADGDGKCDYEDAFVWDNDSTIFGKYYSYVAAQTACPAGWHLPSDDEWKTLELFLGMSEIEANLNKVTARGTVEGDMLKSTSGWLNEENGLDSYGFNGIPGGSASSKGANYSVGKFAFWWTATTQDGEDTQAYYRTLSYNNSYVNRSTKTKYNALNIRCVED